MSGTRTESDKLGEILLPENCLYGIQTARAVKNFDLGFRPVHPELIRAFAIVKKAAVSAWLQLETDSRRKEMWTAAVSACDLILEGGIPDAFPVDALQGGAGTSTHMNVNEAIANLTLRILGEKPGNYAVVHPLDDINRGQSTNDVFPTALRIAAIRLLRRLSDECASLQQSLQEKENAFNGIRKLGRTEWMDAVPITLGSSAPSPRRSPATAGGCTRSRNASARPISAAPPSAPGPTRIKSMFSKSRSFCGKPQASALPGRNIRWT